MRHEGRRIGRGRGDEGEGGDALAGLVGEVEDAVGLAGRHPMDLVADELDGQRATAGTREEVREWDADLADVAVQERTLGAEEDVDGVAGEVDVDGDGEADGGVPGGVAATLAVGRGKLPPPAISGEGDHSVDGHLGDKVYVLKALGRDQSDLQRSVSHGRAQRTLLIRLSFLSEAGNRRRGAIPIWKREPRVEETRYL